MEPNEIFAISGFPARAAARTLLFMRIFFNFGGLCYPCQHNSYALTRHGPHYRWKIWLLFDIKDFENLEDLLNKGSEERLLHFRQSELESFRMVAVIGALISQVATTALTSLPSINETHYTARGLFTVSVVLSVLAIFFTCLQQRTFGYIKNPEELKAWLSNGIRFKNATGEMVFQSSMVTHQLLQAPFELLGISITLFLAGFGVYLGSAYTQNITINTQRSIGAVHANRGVLGAFVAGTLFATLMFGHLFGGKDIEAARYAVAFEKQLLESPKDRSLSKQSSRKLDRDNQVQENGLPQMP